MSDHQLIEIKFQDSYQVRHPQVPAVPAISPVQKAHTSSTIPTTNASVSSAQPTPKPALNPRAHLATTQFGEKTLQLVPVSKTEAVMKLDASLRLSALSVLHLSGMKTLRPVDVRRVIRVRISCALRSNILLLMLRPGNATANGSMGLILPVCGTLL
jgi:hypothetical protein